MDFGDTLPARPNANQEKTRRQTELAGNPKLPQKWWIGGAFIGMYLLAIGLFSGMDLVQKNTVFILMGAIAFALSIFFFLFKTGLNKSFRESHLKLEMIATTFAGMLLVFYFDPATQIVFTPFAFIALAYGMYRIPGKTFALLVASVLLGFALVISLHYRQWHNLALLKLESMHFLALLLSLPIFVVQLSKVQHLNRILHKASRKIKYIQEDAKRDVLVDCYNRRYMVAALEQQKQLADTHGTALCLAVIDLDHFKKINDELGHLGGDEVLRSFSRIAQENVRAEDIFGRYGGEEFLLIFPTTSLLPALNTSERIRSQVEHFAWDDALEQGVSISIGVTQYIPGESVLELFSRADTAMYLAKQGGRNQVVVEEPVLEKTQIEAIRLRA